MYKKFVYLYIFLNIYKTVDFVLPKNPTGDFKLKIFGTFNETMRMYHHDDVGKFLFVQPQLSYYDKINSRQDYKVLILSY